MITPPILFIPFLPLLPLAAIGFLIYWLAERNKERPQAGSSSSGTESATEIARKRYAGGEISRDEFEQIKQDLAG